MFEPSEASGGADEWAIPGVERSRPAVVLSAPVAALEAAVDALAGWAPDSLDDALALAEVQVIIAARQQLQAVQTRALADADARRLHQLEQARSTAVWLREHGLDVPAAELTLARKLAALPAVADELAAGTVSLTVARHLQQALCRLRPFVDRLDGLIDGQSAEPALTGVIIDGVRSLICQARGGYASEDDPQLRALSEQLADICVSPSTQLARLEAAFLTLAAHLEPADLGRALTVLVDALLPAQLDERARRSEQDRRFSLTRHADGTGWSVRGDLDLECGELLHTVLQAELTRDPDGPADTDVAARLREQGLNPYDPDDTYGLPACTRPRSRRQQTHDALAQALTRYLAAGLGGSHDKTPVTITVTVPAATLDGEPGALPARGGSGTDLPASLVRTWACTSTLTRLVLDLAGRAIEASHSGRTLTSHERRALYAQTGGICQAAGCTRTASDLGATMHPHHADPYAQCRTTSLTDTVLLCRASHTDLHHGHPLRLKDGRLLGPDGWIT